MKYDVNLKSKMGVHGVVKRGTGAEKGWRVSWGRGGSPHPKYSWMPVRVGSLSPASLCGYHPGAGGTVSPQLSLEGASPSEIASATAQLLKKLLARRVEPLGPGHVTGLEQGIPARVTPCSQRCWANTSLQPCSRAGRCPSHLHPC